VAIALRSFGDPIIKLFKWFNEFRTVVVDGASLVIFEASI
jgi:hypothetical protein